MSSPDAIPKILRTAACVLLVIFSRAAFSETGDDWARRVWQLDEGLPSANVTGIAQTPDGYLWLATQTGLTRFDGLEFKVIPVPVGRPRPFILAMLLDHAENFWLAEREGSSLIARFGHGAPHLFTTAEGLPDAQPGQLLEAADHAIWICYSDGSVCRITPDDHVTRLTAKEGLPDDGICSLTLDAQGVLWFAKGSQYGYWQENHFEKAGDLKDRNPLILGARNGGLWFCTGTQILRAVSNLPPVAVAAFEGHTDHSHPSAMFEDFNGRLWVGTVSEGLFQLEHTNFFKVETSQNRIRTIFRDHEGSLWVGTDGGGLDRIFPKAVELRGRDEGLPFETVRSLAEDRNGDLWVVTQDGALTRLPDGDWSGAQPVADWPGGIAHNVVMDQEGVMWIGTYRRGLLRWHDGKFSRVGALAGLGGTTIRSLLVDHRGDLWIGL
jgi:ligand-binding sensor domain-containing protein